MNFLERLWHDQPGDFFVISSKSPSSDRGMRDRWFARSEIADAMAEARRLSKTGRNVYFCPHGFDAAKRQRLHAVDPHLLYSDLDAIDPATLPHQPTVLIESSPGRYVGLWRTDKAASEHLNKRMTYASGGDAGGWDRTQLLRVPGTRNWKYEDQPLVKLRTKDGPSYRVKTLERRLPMVAAPVGPIDPDNFVFVPVPLRAVGAAAIRRATARVARYCEAQCRDAASNSSDVSNAIFRIVASMAEEGATYEQMLHAMRNAPQGSAIKVKRGDNVEPELHNILPKIEDTLEELRQQRRRRC